MASSKGCCFDLLSIPLAWREVLIARGWEGACRTHHLPAPSLACPFFSCLFSKHSSQNSAFDLEKYGKKGRCEMSRFLSKFSSPRRAKYLQATLDSIAFQSIKLKSRIRKMEWTINFIFRNVKCF